MSNAKTTLVMVALFATAGGAVAQHPLVTATKKRQEAVKSLEVKFHVKEVVARGAYTAMANELPGGKTGVISPEKDTTIESDNHLVIDGNKVRFENSHPIWSQAMGKFSQNQTISVTNGELSKVLYPNGMGTGTEITGIIRKDARETEIKAYLLVPLLMHFRGMDRDIAPFHVQVFKKGGSLSIGGTQCEEYSHPLSKDLMMHFWYDPARFDLKRIRKYRQGVASENYEIQYQPAPGWDSVPMSWVRTEYESGKLRKTSTVTITDIRINPEIDTGEFEITFPPGTHVHDQRVRKEYRVNDNGEMRELDLYGQENGSSIPQPGTPWITRNKWLLTGIAVTVIVFVVLVFRRRSRKREVLGAVPPL